MSLVISLFHVFFIVPMFFLIAFFRSDIPVWAFQSLLGLGLFVGIYHGYKAVLRYTTNSQYLWVNLIHILFVAPLLVYIGYNQKQTPRWAYEVCILLGSAALGYHTYELVKLANVVEPK